LARTRTQKASGRPERGMRRAEAYRRRSRDLPQRNRILIVCEGARTETLYLGALRAHHRMSTVQIEVHGPEIGTHPDRLVELATSRRNEARAEGSPFDETWCVFDRDEHDHIHESLITAKDRGINVAFSNPCFELWYVLHYRDQAAHIHRAKLPGLLTKALGRRYSKAADLYDALLDRQADALRRAADLRKRDDLHKGGRRENPYTSVDLLVTRLNEMA
jgi:hypothetical protein